MSANHVRQHAGLCSQLYCLRVVTRRDFDLVTARRELRNQGTKERHVRRIGEIDPDAHQVKPKGKSKKAKENELHRSSFSSERRLPIIRISSSASSRSSAKRFSGMILTAIRSLNQ